MLKKLYILLLLFCTAILISGCSGKQAAAFDDPKIQITSDNFEVSFLKTYRLPEGLFRGVFWPDGKRHTFESWLIDKKGNDFYVNIPVADDVLSFDEKRATENWGITTSVDADKQIVSYVLEHKLEATKIGVQLPFEKAKHYWLDVFENTSGEQMVMFMNLTDYGIHQNDKGIFGYVILKPRQES